VDESSLVDLHIAGTYGITEDLQQYRAAVERIRFQ
jgi:hypothetical protein